MRACCLDGPEAVGGAFYVLYLRLLPYVTLLCCHAQTSYFGGDIEGVLLTQGAGYGIIVGFGFFFVFLTIALVYGDYRARGGRHYNSEDFNTAGAPQAAGRCIQHVVLSSGFRCTAGSALVFEGAMYCWPSSVLCSRVQGP